MRVWVAAFAILVGFSLQPSLAAIPAGGTPQMASIAKHDDGAEYVWRVFCNSGLRYSFIPASQFPNSQRFEEVTTPQTGDIAWWPDFVAIYMGQEARYITASGFLKLADLSSEGNPPHYYRMRVLPGEKTNQKPAAGECERNLL